MLFRGDDQKKIKNLILECYNFNCTNIDKSVICEVILGEKR